MSDLLDGIDPETHPYTGDGTTWCPVCHWPMNAHITFVMAWDSRLNTYTCRAAAALPKENEL